MACDGSGEWFPTGNVDRRAIHEAADVLFLCAQTIDHGRWPGPGSVQDQTEWYHDAVQWFATLRAKSRERDKGTR